MKKFILSMLIIILLLPLAACAAPVSADVLMSDKPRDTSPDADAAELATLVEGNSAFAFDLYRALSDRDGNLFYSPHSLSLALAMTWAGARGETEQQMADTLHYLLGDGTHAAMNSLDLELARRGQVAEGKDGEGFRLNIVNAIWGQRDFEFLPDYLDIIAENYGAGLRTLDFAENPEESRVTINDWVSEQTEERIKDLIPEGMIDAMTRLVLTNAIYFNAAWQYPFSEDITSEGTFRLLDGSEITVPMMRQTESFGYAEGDNYQAVELLYDGGELSMVVLLPDAGEFEAFEETLQAEQVAAIIDNLQYNQVALTMPKFEFESEFGLKDILSQMGMPLAFTDSADFSGMTGSPNLYIGEVVHKAFVGVDEAGTEAAAASAVIMQLTSAMENPAEVTIDRPFIFLIRDIETGAVLFVGRVMNPEA